MKARLGEMTCRRRFTKSKASSRLTRRACMRYARQMVADREIPAWQWTSTRPPLSFIDSADAMKFSISFEVIIIFLNDSDLLISLGLTNEVDGLWKEDAYVCGQTVLHLQSFVLKLLFKKIGTGRGYIEHSRDPASLQSLPSGWVMCTAQKQKGEDFNWTTLESTKERMKINECIQKTLRLKYI